MLNRLLGATAIGVVFAVGGAMSAQAQVVDCEETGPFEITQTDPSDGDVLDTPVASGEFFEGFQCGTGSSASEARALAIGGNATAAAENATAIGYEAIVAAGSENGTAVDRPKRSRDHP
ncbi:MAG: hypothetical protein AAFZ74_17395 [Pseudomonadota bacterium]